MKITVLLFSRLREMVGKERLEVALPQDARARDVLPLILHDKQHLDALGSCLLFAVNRGHVRPDASLNDGDELALLPPVSGG